MCTQHCEHQPVFVIGRWQSFRPRQAVFPAIIVITHLRYTKGVVTRCWKKMNGCEK